MVELVYRKCDVMKVLCIGHATYDITIPVDNFPMEDTKIRVQERVECCGGPASNAAYLLGKWGVDTSFAGIVGNDYFGKQIRDEFRKVNVNIDYLQFSNIYQTPYSLIIANKENGSRTVLSYHNSSLVMNSIDIDNEPNVILIDGQESEMSKKVIEKYPEAISIIDAGRDKLEVIELCKIVDYIICSKSFAEKVSNITIIDDSTLDSCLSVLNSLFKGKVIVTLGEDGCAYKEDTLKIIPSYKTNSVDTTGAGDIFHGAFVYAIINNWNLDKALKFSNLAGAMSSTKVGARNSMFELKEMEKALNELE